MAVSIAVRNWTRDDLQRLPDDGNRYEVVAGELFVTPAPPPSHEMLVHLLARRLRAYVEEMNIGSVWHAPTAVVIENSEVQPDLQVRVMASPAPDRWDDVPAPFLVAEVLSNATRRRDLGAKRSLYGVARIDYWIVDGESRVIQVMSSGVERICTEVLEWHPLGAERPLHLDVRDIFLQALG